MDLLLGMLTVGILFFSPFIVIAVFYYANRKRIISGEFYKVNKATFSPEPYENKNEAIKALVTENAKYIMAFSVYFIIVIVILNKLFGNIQYGPNLPYLVSLAVIGIPFLLFFYQIMTIIDKQRYRLIATGISSELTSFLIICTMFILSSVLIIIIKMAIKYKLLLF